MHCVDHDCLRSMSTKGTEGRLISEAPLEDGQRRAARTQLVEAFDLVDVLTSPRDARELIEPSEVVAAPGCGGFQLRLPVFQLRPSAFLDGPEAETGLVADQCLGI